MLHQLELKPLYARLQDRLSRAVTPGRLFLGETEMKEVIEALAQHSLNEATVAAIVFGDAESVGKQWRDIHHALRQMQAVNAELTTALDQLRNTFICSGCGTRLPNTEANRLAHVAACDKRTSAEQQLAAQLATARSRISELESQLNTTRIMRPSDWMKETDWRDEVKP